MSLRTRVGVVFGGPSREHGVSFLSARCLLEYLPADRYESIPVFVGKDGLWHGVAASREEMLRYFARPPREALLDGVVPGSKPAAAGTIVDSFGASFRDGAWDVVLPIVHGTFGEDGVLQGLLEAMNVPYVGFGVAASAVGMDKVLMKAAFAAAGLPQVRYVGVPGSSWRTPALRAALLPRIEALGLPLFVKPACAGSSVGITKVKRAEDLEAAVEAALAVDATALVEEAAAAREIECAVLEGEGGPTEASLPGEIVPGHEFYDYEDKYIDDRSYCVIPADVPEATREEIRRMACAAFDAVGGAGFARVDFFLERASGRVLLNEINSLPGFTPISMFPKMWEASGLPLGALLDRLVRSAFRRPLRGR
ncbi:MAG: D-alanine--D-alanine ligase family protein [Thermoanaerobaculia bacterium]